MKEEGNYTAQAFGYRWFLQNYAYENFTIWLIECSRQTFLLNNKKWHSSFGEYFNWINEQKNDEGDFVYFAHTKKPLVVPSLSNNMTTEQKAKADANGGMIGLGDFVRMAVGS